MKASYNIFVSMPYGLEPEDPNNEWTKLYNFGIMPLIDNEILRKSDLSLNIYRADHTLKDLGLKKNVMACIESSDIVICVLTQNENVFWEIGYAEALEKPIVFMGDRSSLKKIKLPVLAGQPNFCRYDQNVVRDSSLDEDKGQEVLRQINHDLIPYVKHAIQHIGHTKVGRTIYKVIAYTRREEIYLDKVISEAKRRVDVLVTNLDWFVSQGKFQLEKGKEQDHPFQKAINNGARVRILAMDPEAIISEYRAKQLGKGADIPGYREVLRKSIIRVFSIFRGDNNFNLRIYNELPLQYTFIIDDIIITGIIVRGERSRDLIHVEFDKGSEGVTESFLNHFESLFNASSDASQFNWVTRDI